MPSRLQVELVAGVWGSGRDRASYFLSADLYPEIKRFKLALQDSGVELCNMSKDLGHVSAPELYRIGELADRVEMSAATLRSWERRYGLFSSLRSPGGQRLYTSADLERVQRVRGLVDAGWTVGGAVAATDQDAGANANASSPAGSAHSSGDFHRRMLDVIDQAVITTDASGRIIFWNAAAERLYGWPAEEVVGHPILDVVTGPEDQAEAAAIVEDLQRGLTWTGRFPVRRRDGTTINPIVRDTPLRSPAGEIEALVGVSFDDSEHRAATDTVKRQAAQIEAVAVLGAQALRGDTATLLIEAIDIVRRLLDATHVALISTRSHEFTVVAAIPEAPAATSVPSRRSLAGFTARAGHVVIADSMATERRFTAGSLIDKQGAASAVAAPLIGPAGISGVLVATSTDPSAFRADDGQFLQAVANILAGLELQTEP